MNGFQYGAFQPNSFQNVISYSAVSAFQGNAFQFNAFQTVNLDTTVTAFQGNAFQFDAFQINSADVSVPPTGANLPPIVGMICNIGTMMGRR